MITNRTEKGTFAKFYERILISCACGCGIKRLNFDGRHHYTFVKGHQKRGVQTKHNQSTIEKIRNSKIGTGLDDQNPSWVGGKWSWAKKNVLRRDDFTCQSCGLRDPEIVQVDHISPLRGVHRKDVTHKLSNLQALCPNCHVRKTNNEKRQYARERRNEK